MNLNIWKKIGLTMGLISLSQGAFAAQGDVITSYGNVGVAVTPLSDQVIGAEMMSGDRLVIGGIGSNASQARFSRLLSNGQADSSFGTNGIVTLSPSQTLPLQNFSLNDFALTGNNQIVGLGYALDPVLGGDGAVFKLNNNGSLDTNFGNGIGMVQLSAIMGTSTMLVVPYALAIDNQSSLYISFRDGYGVRLAKLLANGTLDTSFGNGQGYVYFAVGNSQSVHEPHAINLLPSGHIIVSGSAFTSPQLTNFAVKLDANGNFDATFGVNGKVEMAAGYQSHFFKAKTDPSGRLLAQTRDCQILRLNPNGMLDTTFGNAGFANLTTPVSGTYECRGLTIRPTGAPVLTGMHKDGTSKDILVARFDNTGQLVNSFNGTGVQLIGQPIINDISDNAGYVFPALQSDGTINVATRGTEIPFGSHIALAIEDTNLNISPRPANLGTKTTSSANTWVSSNMMQVNDLPQNETALLTLENGVYSVNGLPYTNEDRFVKNNDLIVVRLQSPSCFGCTTSASLNIGGKPDSKNAGQRVGQSTQYNFNVSTGKRIIEREKIRETRLLLP